MSENEVKRHPFPEEKPKREGVYLVNLKDEEVTSDWFNSGYSRFYVDDVIAWAERPKPLKPITNTGKITTLLAIIASNIAERGKPYSEVGEILLAFFLASDWGLYTDKELGREFGFRFKTQILEQYDFSED